MLKTAKVVGLNSDTAAALALISPWLVSEQNTGGQRLFLAVVSCECEDAFSKVRQALSLAEEGAISLSEPAAERLPKILGDIKEFLKGADTFAALLVAVVEDNEGTALYLLSEGEGLTAELIREGRKNNLSGLGEGQVVSGILEGGDRVVLSTESLLDFFNGDLSSLEKVPIESFEDEVAVFLPDAQANPLAAVILEKEKPAEVADGETKETALQEVSVLGDKLRPSLPKINLNPGKLFGHIVPRSKKAAVILGVVLLLAAALFGGITYKKNQESQAFINFTDNLNRAKEAVSKSESLKESDPAAALASLEEAKKFIANALTVKPDQSEALTLKEQIEKYPTDILKVNAVEDFPVWLDLSLIKDGFSAKNLSISRGKILILDTNKRTLVSVNTKTKSHEVLAGEDKIGEAKIASINGDVFWVYSEDKGVIRLEGGKAVVVAKPDKEWGEIAEAYGFAGNIYLLDEGNPSTGSGQIWKYLPIASGFSDRKEYLKEGVTANFEGVRRMQIESSIYVLKSGGEMLRFTQGGSDFFSFSGLDKPVRDPQNFFVSSETESLYLLDGGNNRLLVLDKKGVYKAQYQSDKFSKFSDLVVDEAGEKVYLLEGSKIYSIELK